MNSEIRPFSGTLKLRTVGQTKYYRSFQLYGSPLLPDDRHVLIFSRTVYYILLYWIIFIMSTGRNTVLILGMPFFNSKSVIARRYAKSIVVTIRARLYNFVNYLLRYSQRFVE